MAEERRPTRAAPQTTAATARGARSAVEEPEAATTAQAGAVSHGLASAAVTEGDTRAAAATVRPTKTTTTTAVTPTRAIEEIGATAG